MAIPSEAAHPTLKDYLDKETPKASFWINKPKFFVSLLKAFWGEAATPDNHFAYDYLPKIGKGYQGSGYSWIPLFEAMNEGSIKGMLVWGMNPAVSAPNLTQAYSALGKLEWLAAFDLWETDTSVFWKRPGAKTKDIKTEVFLFPAADSMEKEGSVSNSGRWIQWRYQAVKPHGDAQSDLWYANRLGLELKKLYKDDPKAVCPDPIVKLNWNYGDDPDVHLVAKEINGYTVADKKQLANFLGLKDDGSTAGGCWIYSGYYPGPDKKDNKAAARDKKDPTGLGLYPGWAFAWPVNRRIIYNRCSLDPQGQPWSKDKALFAWDPVAKTWKNFDVPDFKWIDPATKVHVGPEESAKAPFLMLPEGKSRIFVPGGACKEGPFPEHYEALECPYVNPMSAQQSNPVMKVWKSEMDRVAQVCDPKYPIIATTFRVTEHWQAGAMTRNLTWQAEMMPEMFVEISPTLAKARGIKAGDWVKVKSVRGEVMARADVTRWRLLLRQLRGIGQGPLSHAPRGQEPDLRARRGLQGRPLTGALRGFGMPLREPHERPAVQPGDEGVEIGDGSGGPGLRSQVSHHRHDLPGDGALAGRDHDPEPHLAGGDGARDVRGDQPHPGQGPRHQGGGLGQGEECPGRGDGPGRCHQPGGALLLWQAGFYEHRGDGGPALALRVRRSDHRRSRLPAELRRQPTVPHGGRRQHHDPGIQGIPGGCAKGLRGRKGDYHE